MMSGVDSKPRRAFTPGWDNSMSKVEALPIKAGGKIVHIHRTKQHKARDDDDEIQERIIDDEEEEVEEAVKAVPTKGPKDKTKGDGEKKSKKATLQERFQTLQTIPRSQSAQSEVQQNIANICMHITASPETCIMKKRKGDATEAEDSDEETFHINDLFHLLETSTDAYLLEITLLSTALVFKDICPSYRIRTKEDQDSDQHHEQQLKKETKQLIEYETTLISVYQKFLQYLDQFTMTGLGNPQTAKLNRSWNLGEKTGFIALRCQCELLKSLYAFNLRTLLLTAITSRATQMHTTINQLCCDTLNYVVSHDVMGDTSFEFVGLLNKMLKIAKFTIPDELLRVLQHIKVSVHADDTKKYQKMAKNEKKKRKRMKDDVLVGMMESDANGDVIAKRRFQANTLQEISLVYFRILKQKVGFNLLPTALDGLGRITHLLDMDTVVDLMAVLRSMLEAQPPVPLNVRVLCIHCALKTLSGPGAELKIDDEVYLTHLRHCLRELPTAFSAWNPLLECIDLCLLKKREERTVIVAAIVRLLFMNVSMHAHDFGPVLLSLTHMILLRYPRVRQDVVAIKTSVSDIQKAPKNMIKALGKQMSHMEEDRVEDLAMKALIEGEASKNSIMAADEEETHIGDGSWLLPLLKHSVDKNRYKHVVDTMMVRDLIPLPLRLTDVNKPAVDVVFDRMEAALSACPPASKLFADQRGGGNGQHKQSGNGGKHNGGGHQNKKQRKR